MNGMDRPGRGDRVRHRRSGLGGVVLRCDGVEVTVAVRGGLVVMWLARDLEIQAKHLLGGIPDCDLPPAAARAG